tara:strand:+ start:454 stop:1632 length:1179 start_codon:yes stop_codon:yes gene_type:complete
MINNNIIYYKLIISTLFLSICFGQSYKLSGEKIFNFSAESVVFVVGSTSFGSGVFVTDNGDVITNYHVIEDSKSDDIFIVMYEGIHELNNLDDSKFLPAEIISFDKTKDLALLRLKKNNIEIKPINFAFNEDISIGSQVFAIGHPGGLLWSFTEGIVNRIAEDSWSYGVENASTGFFDNIYNWWFDLEEDVPYTVTAKTIFTQTPINPGNSGGLLLNSEGLLVGINTAIDLTMNNVNKAIHGDEVEKFLKKNDIILYDNMTINENLSERSSLISNFVLVSDPEIEGYYFITKFDGVDIQIDFAVPSNNEDAPYIGIDFDNDGYHDTVLYDLNGDSSYSFWDIDIDLNGDIDWSGNVFSDKMSRKYRRFFDKVDSMLIKSFEELERLELIIGS